ncbi:hypothetical protein SAMN05444695_105203 [Rhodococcus triatomae]|uniref:DUF7847 domain-containing protein n=1 Tax=Rhodococcus triatomae TaxID=300028 RepID=A0A1G8I9G0_9NOCA|nr:hypothetical protein SAMN05444695_105203 [Rhodococcus triatomae]
MGDAISYGWSKFTKNWLVWVGIGLIFWLIQALVGLLNPNFSFDTDSASGSTMAAFSIWGILVSLIGAVIGILIQAAMVRGALHELDGNKPVIGSFFQFTNVAAIFIAAILVGILTTIGFILLIIPGLVVLFFTWWTMQFVIDQEQDAITAIKSSFRTISQNAGTLFLLALALVGINIVGALLCGIGLLVTTPVTLIASTYAYRLVTGRFISAPA